MSSSSFRKKKKRRKGLSKIKFYCQVCEKECSDQNGFDMHKRTAGHLKRMAVFAANPQAFEAKYSAEFERVFMDLMATQFRASKVLANKVHNEYVKDRDSVRMNATRWVSLDAFVRELAERGKVELDYDDQGLPWIKYIDAGANALRAQVEERDRKRKAKVAAALQARREQEMRAAAQAHAASAQPAPVLALDSAAQSVSLALPKAAAPPAPAPAPAPPPAPPPALAPVTSSTQSRSAGSAGSGVAKPMSAAERIRRKEADARARKDARTPWPVAGAVVRVLDASVLDGAVVGLRGVVRGGVGPDHRTRVAVVEGSHRVELDIDDALLQTVLPREGRPVVVVRGAAAGSKGVLVGHFPESRTVHVKLDGTSKTLTSLPYKAVTMFRPCDV